MIYSSAFRRFLAHAIDCFAIIGLYVLAGFLLSIGIISSAIMSMLSPVGFWFYGGIVFLPWLYYAFFESSSKQATLGKQVMGIKVVDLKGKRISFWRASGRYFGWIISNFLIAISVLMIFFTKKKQALHDKMAKCLVVYQK